MYSLKIQIHPRSYHNQEGQSDALGDFRKSEIIEQNKEGKAEELERKDFINSMIDIVTSKASKEEALKTMNALLGGSYSDKIRADLETLKYHIMSLFDDKGEKKDNYLNRINEIKKAFGIKNIDTISGDEKTRFENFKKKNDISEYKNQIYTFIIEHPRVSDESGLGTNLLKTKRRELNELNISAMNEYEAVLTTIEDLVKTEAFKRNTGEIREAFAGENKKLRMQLFQKIIKDIINTAADTKKPQDVSDLKVGKEFENLTIEEEKFLLERSPDVIYDEYIKGLSTMLNERRLTKEIANNYIDGLSFDIFTIINKLGPNHPLKKIYENKVTQMRALASYDILYNNFGIFEGFFSGNSLSKFFIEAEKGKDIEGSIGYEKGTFKFYSIYQMKEAVMKTGEITGTYDTAWDSYIQGANGKFDKFEGIFEKDGLEALAIYFEQNKSSTLIDKDGKFGEFIKKYLPKNFIINKENYSENIEELTIQKDFPNLEKIIKERGLKMPEQLPKTADGSLDGVKLIFAIIEGNATPDNIEAIKKELDKDFEAIKTKAQQKKLETVDSLKEFKDWKSALASLDINNPIEGGTIITSDLDKNLPIEQQKVLKNQLELKQSELAKNPPSEENNKKLETIKKLLELINADKTGNDATVAQSAAKQTDTKNILDASKSGDRNAQNALANSTYTNARAVNEQQKLDDFQKRNAEIIQNLSVKYNLPLDSTELANPQYLNQINSLIVNLGKKEKLTPDEEIFLDYLQRTKGQIRLNSQSIIAHQELAKSYPEFKETLSNIREVNKTVYENLTPQKLEQYEHIARFIFPEDPVTEMKRDLANLPPGGELDLVKYYSNSDIGNGMRSSISIEECSFTKNGANTGTINFPPYMGIPPMKGVPVHGIESFLSQADLLVRLGFRSLIPALQDINTEVSKKYGKGTNSFDGSFDSYELRRTSTFLCEIIGIELTGSEAIPDITNKINARYSSDGDIRKKLKKMEILTEEGDFRKYQFQEIVKAMNKKTA